MKKTLKIYKRIYDLIFLFLARSSWSREKKPVMEIGDLSERESMDYLVNKRKISSSEANKIYELVGGRIIELKAAADDFLDGKSFKGNIDFIFCVNRIYIVLLWINCLTLFL